jgi:dTDP-4-dehydrorhamnose 3,5-epimerase-like enzyme
MSERGKSNLVKDVFLASSVDVDWLKKQKYEVQNIYKPPTIEGVVLKDLKPIPDGRGDIIELWSSMWGDDGFELPLHIYKSGTDFGVVKGWHLHEKHTDQMCVFDGKIQISLVDIRKFSPRVMHGWKALSAPSVDVINFQTDVYRPEDEFKFPWDCVLSDIWEPKNG